MNTSTTDISRNLIFAVELDREATRRMRQMLARIGYINPGHVAPGLFRDLFGLTHQRGTDDERVSKILRRMRRTKWSRVRSRVKLPADLHRDISTKALIAGETFDDRVARALRRDLERPLRESERLMVGDRR